MTRRFLPLAATLLVAGIVTGCSESATPQATGKGNIRGVNAIVTAPEVGFLIEERTLDTVNFKQTTSFTAFDDLTYNFNFDLAVPGQAEADRLATQFIDVQADHEYTVVLTGSVANASTLFWEDPVREWEGTETVLEVFFAHLAPSLGEFDVYFATPGTVPVLGQAVGSLTNGERLPVMEFEEGPYELILTPKDDPATIVFQSVALGTLAQARLILAIFDPDPSVPGNFAVNVLTRSGASNVLPDARFPSQARMLHTAFGTGNIDGYVEGDFANVVFSDVGFKELSPYADVAVTPALVTLTPVGNPGATIHEDEVAVPAGTRNTIALGGQPGSLIYLRLPDNARPLETFPLLRFVNTSVNTDAVDIYLLEPGTPLDDENPDVPGLLALANTGFGNAPEGMVELAVTVSGEKTPIATPLILDLAIGDRADVTIVDTADPTTVELVLFDFQPGP